MNRSLLSLTSVRRCCIAGLLISGGLVQCVLAQSAVSVQTAVENALGPSLAQDGVLTYTITRLASNTTVGTESVAANFQFAGQLFFIAAPSATPSAAASLATAWVIGEVPLLEEEAPAFVAAVKTGGLSVDALHHHMLLESPRTVYAHISGSGDAAAVAATLKTALAGTGNLFTPVHFSGGTALNDTTLSAVMQGRMNIVNGVVYIKVPRREQFLYSGALVPSAMSPTSMVTMDQPTGKGAKMAFELALLPSEVDAVTKGLIDAGMSITAIHNRTTSLLPDLTIVHGWAMGDSTALAVTIRNLLNKTNSQGSPKAQ
jgi:hypothetical protein